MKTKKQKDTSWKERIHEIIYEASAFFKSSKRVFFAKKIQIIS